MSIMRELTYTQALREALTEEMHRDPNIILLGEDIGGYGGVFKVTEGLLECFGPERRSGDSQDHSTSCEAPR